MTKYSKLFKKPYLKILVVVLIFLLLSYFIDLDIAFYASLFLLFIYFNLKPKILFFSGLIFLACCFLFIILGMQKIADQIISYAYGFFLVGSILIIVGYLREKKQEVMRGFNKRLYEKNRVRIS